MPENHSNNEVENQRSGDGKSSGVPLHGPRGETAQRSTDREQNEQIEKLKRNVVIAVVISIFGPIVAILGVVFAGLQWDVARKALDDSQKAGVDAQKNTERSLVIAESQARSMKTLADANKAMADASKLSAQNSERIAQSGEHSAAFASESVRLDQRAWVGVRGIIPAEFEIGKPLKVGIIITNTGKTPALRVSYHKWGKFAPFGEPPPPEPTRHDTGDSGVRSVQVLQPNQDTILTVTSGWLVTQQHIDEVRAKGRYYFRARIAYDDIFGRTHRTEYCGFLNIDMRTLDYCDSSSFAD